MAALPKKKPSKVYKRQRRHQHLLLHLMKKNPGSMYKSKENGAFIMPHKLDLTTGMYRGVQIIDMDKRKDRAERRHQKLIQQ